MLSTVLQFCTLAIPHVGLLLAVLLYLCFGAVTFQYFEAESERADRRAKLDNVTAHYQQVLAIANELAAEQQCDLEQVRARMLPVLQSLSWTHEYDDRFAPDVQLWADREDELKELWSLPNSVFYALTVATSTGYERVSPETDAGRVFTVLFGLIGIPLLFITAADIGKFFSEVVTSSYTRLVSFSDRVKRGVTRAIPSCFRRIKVKDDELLDADTNDNQVRNGLLPSSASRQRRRRGRVEEPPDLSGLTAEQRALYELGVGAGQSDSDSSDAESDDSDEDMPQLPFYAYFGIMLAYCAFGSALFNMCERGPLWNFIYGFFFRWRWLSICPIHSVSTRSPRSAWATSTAARSATRVWWWRLSSSGWR